MEAAAEMHDLIFDVLQDDYPNVDFNRVRIVLLNAGDHILKGLDPSLVNAATRRLASQQIEVINGAKVEGGRARYRGDLGRTHHTGPNHHLGRRDRTPPFVANLDVDKGPSRKDTRRPVPAGEGQARRLRRGRLHQHAVRRTAHTRPRPGRGTAGQAGGAEPRGGDQEQGARAFHYRPVGQLVDLGEGSAMVDILGVKLGGLLGAVIWKGVYLYELGYDLNRAHVLADWTIDLFTRPDPSKIFEDPEQQEPDRPTSKAEIPCLKRRPVRPRLQTSPFE